MEREKYVDKVETVMLGGREVTVTHTRPVLTPEELLAAQIRVKKTLVKILENNLQTKERDKQPNTTIKKSF